MAITLHSSFAVHPGAWLRAEIVEPHGLSVTTMAGKAARHAAGDEQLAQWPVRPVRRNGNPL